MKTFDRLISGTLSIDEQVALLRQYPLTQLTQADLLECASSILSKAIRLPLLDAHTVDLVGTGGDGQNTFNVSTTAAFVAAASGVKIAKHGNRAITSRSGSFDVLEALGVPVPQTAEAAQDQFLAHGITFLFAPIFHPVLATIREARQRLSAEKIKTIFNVLGPLVNPMPVKRHALGVFHPSLIQPYVHCLKQMGAEKALVFHGDGLDELSITGPNTVAVLQHNDITVETVLPDSLPLQTGTLQDLRGGDAQENAAITLSILQNKTQGPKRDMVVLNAAAAICAATDGPVDFIAAIGQANDALDSGAAMQLLANLRGQHVNPE